MGKKDTLTKKEALKLLQDHITNLNDYAGEEVVVLLANEHPIYKIRINVGPLQNMLEGNYDNILSMINGIKMGILVIEYNIKNLTDMACVLLKEAANLADPTPETIKKDKNKLN